jgi:Tfp pilus assembly protein PilF
MNRLVYVLALACWLPGCQPSPPTPALYLQQQQARRLELQSRSREAYDKAMEAWRKGDLAKARSLLREAAEADGRSADVQLALGVVAVRCDDLFEAAQAFDRANALAPDRYEPLFNLGCLLESVGKTDQAIARYEEALKLAPDQLDVMENLARCYVQAGSNPEQARRLIRRALKKETRADWLAWLESQAAALESKEKSDD